MENAETLGSVTEGFVVSAPIAIGMEFVVSVGTTTSGFLISTFSI